jgi:hypothetical protein
VRLSGIDCQVPGLWCRIEKTRRPEPGTRYLLAGFGCDDDRLFNDGVLASVAIVGAVAVVRLLAVFQTSRPRCTPVSSEAMLTIGLATFSVTMLEVVFTFSVTLWTVPSLSSAMWTTLGLTLSTRSLTLAVMSLTWSSVGCTFGNVFSSTSLTVPVTMLFSLNARIASPANSSMFAAAITRIAMLVSVSSFTTVGSMVAPPRFSAGVPLLSAR